MSINRQDGFDHYGDSLTEDIATVQDRMKQGWWAGFVGNNAAAYPAFGARAGAGALKVYQNVGSDFTSSSAEKGARLILPSTYTEVFFHFGIYLEGGLPVLANQCGVALHDSGNIFLGGINFQTDGSIAYRDSAGSQLGVTSALAVSADTWHHIQLRVKKSATVGIVEVWVDNVRVLNLTAQNTGATAIGEVQFVSRGASTAFWIDDWVSADTSGSSNNSLMGDLKVATTYVVSDTTEANWEPQTRAKFGNGIGQWPTAIATSQDALSCADSADFELGAGDFTMEGFVRFLDTPTGASQYVTLFSKWRSATNERAYQFILGSTAFNGAKLEFRISTDGTAGTLTTIVKVPFSPVFGHWHHLAVQRASGAVTIFVDGVAMNAPVTDANNYNNNTSLFTIGGEQNGATSFNAGQSLYGFMEEVRITKGVGRYTGGFTPPVAAYSRNVGGDASFASVSLLLGFDTAITDESSFGRAVTARGNAVRYAVDDTQPGDYKTINNVTPRDDTYMEASFLAATGLLTLTANPSNNETVVFDTHTYTFKTVLTPAAGEVLIGAATTNSIDNLVAAINGAAGSGTLYGAGTSPSVNATVSNIGNGVMKATANSQGTGGNSIGSTETLANGSWTGATLSGGVNIPSPSRFNLDRLPPATTGVRALSIVARSRKSDSGAGNLQVSFVTADASTANGANRALTTTFAFNDDIIETDPSTSGPLTPASFVGASIRVDRTA